MSFAANLVFGLLGESIIARWLNSKGWDVLPAYQVESEDGKGPRLYTASVGKLVTPDLLVFNAVQVMWAEAKRKTVFTWHRISNNPQTGIDLNHWREYLKVADVTPFAVWMLFLHEPGNMMDNGEPSPSGLYGASIEHLEQHVDHEHMNHGRHGMVYWNERDLTKIATYEEVVGVASCSQQRTPTRAVFRRRASLFGLS